MANQKISTLPTVTTLTGTEEVPLVQGGITKTATAQQIADLAPAPTVAWDDVSGKPATFAPSAHMHDYAPTSHTHTASEITDLKQSFVVACSDETTAITAGTAKVTFRMPYAFTLTAVRASLTTASSSGLVTADINEGGTSILGTNKLSIDANEKTSTTAATAVDLSDVALADDAEITIDIDTAGTGAKGLKVALVGRPA
jgi:hypothetical protein